MGTKVLMATKVLMGSATWTWTGSTQDITAGRRLLDMLSSFERYIVSSKNENVLGPVMLHNSFKSTNRCSLK